MLEVSFSGLEEIRQMWRVTSDVSCHFSLIHQVLSPSIKPQSTQRATEKSTEILQVPITINC